VLRICCVFGHHLNREHLRLASSNWGKEE